MKVRRARERRERERGSERREEREGCQGQQSVIHTSLPAEVSIITHFHGLIMVSLAHDQHPVLGTHALLHPLTVTFCLAVEDHVTQM